MRRRRMMTFTLAMALVMPAATWAPTALAADDPQDNVNAQTDQTVPELIEPSTDNLPTVISLDDMPVEQLPADVLDAVATHSTEAALEEPLGISDDELTDALAQVPDCDIAIGEEIIPALINCGATINGVEPATDPDTDDAGHATPDPAPSQDPNVEEPAVNDAQEDSNTEQRQAPGADDQVADHATEEPTEGLLAKEPSNEPMAAQPLAMGTQCDKVNGWKDMSRTVICGHTVEPITVLKGKNLIGSATEEVVMRVTLNPKSLANTFEAKARLIYVEGLVKGMREKVKAGLVDATNNNGPQKWADMGTIDVTTTWNEVPRKVVHAPSMARGQVMHYRTAVTFVHLKRVPNKPDFTMWGTISRCDDTKVRQMGRGCVTNFVPTLTYSKTGLESAVAVHIEKAAAMGAPLTLHREYPVGNNRSQTCPRSVTRLNQPGYQCDEYPFNTAVEGGTTAPRGTRHPIIVPDGCNYPQVTQRPNATSTPTSRCQVPAADNGAAGSKLSQFLLNNRIHGGEAYNVKIIA